ncbi:MAG TPA: hypothetical protein VFW46_14490 [Stellaceae bacterium]|nr:hypothetical protein [Stellaceae bacterium]
MTPQGNFLVMAPVIPGREDELRQLLASMNATPGAADSQNALIPFGRFDRLHFARLLILTDPTADDIAIYDVPAPELPPTLVFFGDCDGSGAAFLEQLAAGAAGLRRIFACCDGFSPDDDLLEWMRRHGQAPIANYVNTIGRTVRQIREEAALHDALADYLGDPARAVAIADPHALQRDLVSYVAARQASGELVLSEPEPTPLGWRLRNALNLAVGPLIGMLLLPFVLIYLPVFFWQLRRRETTDPQITPRPGAAARAEIARHEDYDVTNPYLVIGGLKPGLFRRLLTIALLSVVDYGARHIFNRGHLARVKTIHFARWVFLNSQKQMFFASNYDGSLEAYMDDFINKVGWGLNLLFSNGVGYPKTNWLVQGGSDDEQKFEYYIFRHQLPIDVWYKAYPGLTAFDLTRNTLIRAGLTRLDMTDDEVREWLNLI